jgi:hypothetical protein
LLICLFAGLQWKYTNRAQRYYTTLLKSSSHSSIDKSQNKMGDLDKNKLTLISACVCCLSGLYTDIPGCIGASGKGEFLCIVEEVCIKADRLSSPLLCKGGEGDLFCTLGLLICACSLKKPTTCCKGQSQCFCCWGAAALPTDSDVPMACALLFLTLYPKQGCCMKIGEL